MSHISNLDKTLAVMGFSGFKSVEQQQLVETVIDGKDAIGILPTGAGKSAAFIIPTLHRRLCTLVISPLMSLMEDQVQKLRKQGVAAYAIHSGIDPEEKLEALLSLKMAKGKPRLVFSTPETVLSESFQERFGSIHFDLLAVDEAHCVSTWGNSFRPNYLRLWEVARVCKFPQLLAISATVDKYVEKDIHRRVPFRDGVACVKTSPYRDNLTVSVETLGQSKNALGQNRSARQRLMQLLDGSGPTIIYCSSRDRVVTLFKWIRHECESRGYTPAIYHARVDTDSKQHALQCFLSRKKPLIIATSAFGMGIDRPDIRLVVHYDTPHTLIDYAQQIGRAGRDDLPSQCVTFHNPDKIRSNSGLQTISIPACWYVERMHRLLAQHIQKHTKKENGTFNLSNFIHHQIRIERSKGRNASHAEVREAHAKTAVAILQRIGAVYDSDHGTKVRDLSPGSDRHLKLIGATKMSERMIEREMDRLHKFFGAESPSQELLWEIIGN